MNNQYPYNNQYATPQQAQPVMPAAPAKQPGFIKQNLMGIIVCACGIASVALGIGSFVAANNVFGAAYASRSDAAIAAAKAAGSSVVPGPAPVVGLLMAIFAGLFAAAAIVLGLIFGNKMAEEGTPKSTAMKVGIILGAVGALIFLFAIFFTSCSTCSYCSFKNEANNPITSR